jgi:putative transposase
MAARSIAMNPQTYYHIYNRGNNGQAIFHQPENYNYFREKMTHYFGDSGVDVFAYCLMPNHFHLLVYFEEPLNFPKVMRAVSTSYAKSFNKYYQRHGHLFEGDYQAKELAIDDYLGRVIRYIHLNPVRAKLVSTPDAWPHADYKRWAMDQTAGSEKVQELRYLLFGTAKGYRSFVEEEIPDEAEAPAVRSRLQTR